MIYRFGTWSLSDRVTFHPSRCVSHTEYLISLISDTALLLVQSGNEVTNRVLFEVTGLMRRGGFEFADNG